MNHDERLRCGIGHVMPHCPEYVAASIYMPQGAAVYITLNLSMGPTSLVQLLSSCIGIVGSLFFVIGVVRQSTEAMGKLSQSYYDANPHQPRSLAMQKADYVFGGGLIVAAFTLQFLSFLAPSNPHVVSAVAIPIVMAIAFIGTVLSFLILRVGARKLGMKYEQQIQAWLEAEDERYRKEKEAQKAAQRAARNAET